VVSFDRLALVTGDRAAAAGGTQSGKSTLCAGSPEYPFRQTLCGEWVATYCNPKDKGKLLIVDSKPRFRAAYRPDGLSDSRRYKDWGYGPAIPNSTRVDPGDIQGLYRAMNLSDIIIVQTDSIDRDAPLVMRTVEAFRRTAGKKHKRLVYFDELMDFYSQSGMPLRGCGNVALRCARAGAERDLTTLYAFQRAKGIPPQLWELLNKLYLFRMDLETDMTRIREAGVPREMVPPEEDHIFLFWTKKERRRVFGPYSLKTRRSGLVVASRT
jgi:hypothetical protein